MGWEMATLRYGGHLAEKVNGSRNELDAAVTEWTDALLRGASR